ncbi:MAG: hypothetical protein JST39_08065 [Bacteroidetes bacterium]|nr:hypothetical protein [Bacteroidota bacterium]
MHCAACKTTGSCWKPVLSMPVKNKATVREGGFNQWVAQMAENDGK